MSCESLAQYVAPLIQNADKSDLALLRFYEYRGKVMSWHNESPVYGHKNYDPIKAGESWYCRLEKNNGQNGLNYFAIPIRSVDADLLYELCPEHRADLTRIIIEEFPEEARLLIGGTVDNAESEKDGQSSRIQEQAVGNVVESVGDVVSDESSSVAPPTIDESTSVVRSGPTALSSNHFINGKYDVFISRDHRKIRIIQRFNGALVCSDHTIVVPGLDSMIPYNGEIAYNPSVNENSGAITITVY